MASGAISSSWLLSSDKSSGSGGNAGLCSNITVSSSSIIGALVVVAELEDEKLVDTTPGKSDG